MPERVCVKKEIRWRGVTALQSFVSRESSYLFGGPFFAFENQKSVSVFGPRAGELAGERFRDDGVLIPMFAAIGLSGAFGTLVMIGNRVVGIVSMADCEAGPGVGVDAPEVAYPSGFLFCHRQRSSHMSCIVFSALHPSSEADKEGSAITLPTSPTLLPTIS